MGVRSVTFITIRSSAACIEMFSTVTMYDATVYQRVLTCSIDRAMMPLLPHIQSGAHHPGFRVIQSLSSVFSPLVSLLRSAETKSSEKMLAVCIFSWFRMGDKEKTLTHKFQFAGVFLLFFGIFLLSSVCGMMAHPQQLTSHAVHTRRHVLNTAHVQIPVNAH